MIKIRFRKAQKGQGLVEYATIVSLVSVVSIVILSILGIAVARNYGVIAAVFGGQKNAASSAVTGLTNTIYYDPTTVICHIGTTQTYVTLTLYASPDIRKEDLMYTANSITSTEPTAGPAATVNAYIAATISGTSASYCPDSVVISGKKAIVLAPVTSIVP